MHSILAYHTISSPPSANKNIARARFARHLKWLARRRHKADVVSLDEAVRSPPGRRLVALTFDDAFRDRLTVALPLAEHFAMPITVFVTADHIGCDGYLDAEGLRRLAAHPLVTIGSHGKTHRRLTRLKPHEVWVELNESRRLLEQVVDRPVEFLAYPHGDCDFEIEKMTRLCGYRAAWSVWDGANTTHSRPRVPLGREDDLLRFVLKQSRFYLPFKRRLRPPRSHAA